MSVDALLAGAQKLLDAGLSSEAAKQLREGVRLYSGVPRVHYKLGVALQALADRAGAREQYRKTLELDPRHPEAHNNLGCLLQAEGDRSGAMDCYRAALQHAPDLVPALTNLAIAFLEQRDFAQAEHFAARALGLNPASAYLHRLLGDILREAGKFQDSVEACRRAVVVDGADARAHNSLGLGLLRLGLRADAEAAFRKACSLEPGFAEARLNLGLALEEAGDDQAALAQYRTALQSQPDSPEALLNQGVMLERLYDSPEAIECYRAAIERRPDFAQAHFNYALQLLSRGYYERGWREFEWRWEIPELEGLRPEFPAPQWRGEELRGRKILLHTEMGFGDAIQFVRYAPLLAERGAQVWLHCPQQLARLLRPVAGISGVVAEGSPLPSCDYSCALLSLPHLLNTTFESIPARVPYILEDAALRDAMAEMFREAGDALKIGLVWASHSRRSLSFRKTIALGMFEPLLLSRGDARFFSLQKAPSNAETADFGRFALKDCSALLRDFADTAACIAHLDLVIACDTAVAHLAGAMGKPVWTLVPFPPDWRWRREGERCAWYPTMRLFRRPASGNWAEVIAEVKAELQSSTDKLRHRGVT